MLPIQKKSLSAKNEKWRQECVDALEALCYGNAAKYRSDLYRKRINYDLFNGKFNKQDLEYVTNPFGVGPQYDSSPASLQHYDIISPDLLLLMGEESKRAFNFRVVTQGRNDVNASIKKKRELVDMYIQSVLFDQQTGQVLDPEQIEKYMKYSYKDLKEMTAQALLDYPIKSEDLEFKFNEGWK